MSIALEGLSKRYGGTPVVAEVSLEVATGELFVLLGPSGSGKSTLLRMIAGLTELDAGRVRLHDRDVTRVSPRERGIGFVFQHYALFRQMSVADNVEFALAVRRVAAAERRRRREELLALVGLGGFGNRLPGQLSGGQQQRVALARALAHRPPVLLLDEPFGALDAKIRVELRQTLRRIQRELGLTTVFVTHDQEEAFELGDRVGVMHTGRLLEVGRPTDLYLRPRSAFVATFLGVANLLVGESTPAGLRLGTVALPPDPGAAAAPPRRVQVLFRPEDLELGPEPAALGSLPLARAVVEERTFSGAFERLRLRLPPLPRVRQISPAPSFGGSGLLLEAVRPQPESLRFPLERGEGVWVGVRRTHVLAPARIELLVLADGSPAAAAALAYAAALGEELGSPVVPLAAGPPPPEAAAEAAGFDLLVAGLGAGGRLPAAAVQAAGPRHLLVVPAPCPPPRKLLVCVAVGEPGKVDVRFAERLAWRLDAAATVLTVLPAAERGRAPEHVERFLEASVRALAARGVEATSKVRYGTPLEEILREVAEGDHDLVVAGAHQAAGRPGEDRLGGVVGRLLAAPPPRPLLIVAAEERA
jgi:sulfate/thiosulfate transport system ATP-binding protein